MRKAGLAMTASKCTEIGTRNCVCRVVLRKDSLKSEWGCMGAILNVFVPDLCKISSHRDTQSHCRSKESPGSKDPVGGCHRTRQAHIWHCKQHSEPPNAIQGSFAQLIRSLQCSGIKMFPEWQQAQTGHSQQQVSRASKKMGTHSYFSLFWRKVFLPCNNGGGHISWRVLT